MARIIQNLIIHCSDSNWGDRNIIRQWHLEKGWKDILYSFVILNGNIDPDKEQDFEFLDGCIEVGRLYNDDNIIDDLERGGSGALGMHDNSVGICMIGTTGFTEKQFISLRKICVELCKKWNIPVENILGHYETEEGKKIGKTCPNFNVSLIRSLVKEDLNA